jgi:hypothetical protein
VGAQWPTLRTHFGPFYTFYVSCFSEEFFLFERLALTVEKLIVACRLAARRALKTL